MQKWSGKVEWIDSGRTAKDKPNPAFPDGRHVGPVGTPMKHCVVPLRRALDKRIGCHRIVCDRCGQTVLVTAAGRPDDPISCTLICRGDQSR